MITTPRFTLAEYERLCRENDDMRQALDDIEAQVKDLRIRGASFFQVLMTLLTIKRILKEWRP